VRPGRPAAIVQELTSGSARAPSFLAAAAGFKALVCASIGALCVSTKLQWQPLVHWTRRSARQGSQFTAALPPPPPLGPCRLGSHGLMAGQCGHRAAAGDGLPHH